MARDTRTRPPDGLPLPWITDHSPVTAPTFATSSAPGRGVQDPFLVHGVETHGGAPSAHYRLFMELCGACRRRAFWGSEDAPKIANPCETALLKGERPKGTARFQPSGPRRVSPGAPKLSGRSPARAETSGSRSDPFGKIGTAAEPGAPTAVPHVNRLKSWLTPPFFSPPAIVWLFRLSRGRKEASAVIPRPDGRPTWFDHARAASRIGSRTDPPHCTPRRYVGVDGTRDWPHPSGQSVHQVRRYSKGASPTMTSPDCSPRLASLFRRLRRGDFLRRATNLRHRRNGASA
jgi:hypothetical protein